MFAIIGILVVFAAVIGGFLMEHGPMRVFMQPAELAHHRRRRHRHIAGC